MKDRGRIICLLLILAMTASGCGSRTVPEKEEIILLDPVDDPSGWEEAAFRNLYDAVVYSAAVFPYTEEYSFGKDVVFDEFCAYPGEYVKKGEILAQADDSALQEAIEEKEEQILKMEEEFREYVSETEEKLYGMRSEAQNLLDIVENLQEQEPEEYLPEENSESADDAAEVLESSGPIKNPAYKQWQEAYIQYEGKYRIRAHEADTLSLQLEQRTMLYELDQEYAQKQLARMREEISQSTLISAMEGQVVAVGVWESGSRLSERDKVIAVGDMDRKMLKCQYINKSVISHAKDLYAVIDGRRREILYQSMEAEEYARRSALNETIYSAFQFAEDTEGISAGDFAVIVVVKDMREKVLTVPDNALHKDGEGYYVYVMKDGESRAVNVEIGMGDGVYREVLGGICEGDKVLTPETMTAGEGRVQVEKGNFCSSFSGSGYLSYPSSVKVRNTIFYGRVYFIEYAVSLYQHVEKGDVIAQIQVQQDGMALERNLVKLTRLQERLAIFEAQAAEAGMDKKAYEKEIAARQKEIAQVQELIDTMESDFAATQIKAPQSGIIIRLADYGAEDILPQNGELAEIAEEDICYVVLENKNQQLQYGNQVSVLYTDKEGNDRTAEGMAANSSEGGVESGLRSNDSWILLPAEMMENVAAATLDGNGRMARGVCQVEADVRRMDQVLLIPRNAVWEISGRTYVMVEENGQITARSFIAGGCDASYYWVAEGLTEGMELCLK